jgi:hypothetical protein
MGPRLISRGDGGLAEAVFRGPPERSGECVTTARGTGGILEGLAFITVYLYAFHLLIPANILDVGVARVV